MKKNVFQLRFLQAVLFIFLFLCFSPQFSCASAPKSVDLSYDMSTQNLSVTINHQTLFVGMHYIKYVEIKKNGTLISNDRYGSQPTYSIFTYTYNIPAQKGDVFDVTATCNLWGHKTSTLVVDAPTPVVETPAAPKDAAVAPAPVVETPAAPKDAAVAPVPVVETPAAPKEAAIAPVPVVETPVAPKEAAIAPVPVVETPVAPKEAVVAPAPVAEKPLPEKITIALNMEFDTAKTVVKKSYHKEIEKVADFIKKHPGSTAVIEGYTDNVDKFNKPEKNIKLSQARAESVRQYLIDNFGIDAFRITAVGYGPAKPIASNETKEGRQKNRRVQAVIETVQTK
jgi:outer membrane protein OmpA-like peptidoglycan-associated protein